MKRTVGLMAGWVLLAAGMAFSCAVRADFAVLAPNGRRMLIKDDGTWRYVEATAQDEAKARAEDKLKAEGKGKEEGEAVLTLERKMERSNGCRFAVRLVNNQPYEIRNLVLHYSAYRPNGVIYDTVSSGSAFASLKPGDTQNREFQFTGIACKDIDRLQVVGGDRCVMGELDKFSPMTGQCLARVRVVESELVRFDK